MVVEVVVTVTMGAVVIVDGMEDMETAIEDVAEIIIIAMVMVTVIVVAMWVIMAEDIMTIGIGLVTMVIITIPIQ